MNNKIKLEEVVDFCCDISIEIIIGEHSLYMERQLISIFNNIYSVRFSNYKSIILTLNIDTCMKEYHNLYSWWIRSGNGKLEIPNLKITLLDDTRKLTTCNIIDMTEILYLNNINHNNAIQKDILTEITISALECLSF